MGVDTRAILWGGCALQGGNVRLLEDGCERGGAIGSDPVAIETADKGQSEDGERVARQRALTEKQTLGLVVAHLSEVTALPLSALHSLVMPSVL